MSIKKSVPSLLNKNPRGAKDETESLKHDLLKMIHALERKRTALDSAILALEKVKRGRLAASSVKSGKL